MNQSQTEGGSGEDGILDAGADEQDLDSVFGAWQYVLVGFGVFVLCLCLICLKIIKTLKKLVTVRVASC